MNIRIFRLENLQQIDKLKEKKSPICVKQWNSKKLEQNMKIKVKENSLLN